MDVTNIGIQKLMQILVAFFGVVALLFGFFQWVLRLCHRTVSNLFFFPFFVYHKTHKKYLKLTKIPIKC